MEPYIITIIKSALRKQFPFIKDIRTGDIPWTVEGTLLISAHVDIEEMGSLYNVPINEFKRYFTGKPLTRCYLSTFIDGYRNEEMDAIQEDIMSIVKNTQRHPAIPMEYKTKDYIILTQFTSI